MCWMSLTAVADSLQLDNAGVVDIGGGTTGIAIVKQGKVTYRRMKPPRPPHL